MGHGVMRGRGQTWPAENRCGAAGGDRTHDPWLRRANL